MTTEQIARRLKELCEQGQFEHAIKELYTRRSKYRAETPDFARETRVWTPFSPKGRNGMKW
jgi:hypothetical protein